MAWTRRLHASSDPSPGEGQIAHAIHRLVPHKLVRPSELIVDDAILADHDCVLCRRTANQSLRAQGIHFMHETERACPRELTLERLRRHTILPALLSDERMRKIDRHIQLEVRSRKRVV